jgi:hypothetical protein
LDAAVIVFQYAVDVLASLKENFIENAQQMAQDGAKG